MKIRVEIQDNLTEEEVIIRAGSFSERVQQIQRVVTDLDAGGRRIILFKGDTEYYLKLDEILFFETEAGNVYAHTRKETYQTGKRLYELEELLPGYFMRVSKSSILNLKKIYAVTRSLPSSCVVEFQGTHKQVYVSRYYYKPLRERLGEKR